MDALTPTQIDQLNRSMPAAAKARLGERIAAIEAAASAGDNAALMAAVEGLQEDVTAFQATQDDLVTKFNQLLDKLDADAGVTDTDYAATLAIA